MKIITSLSDAELLQPSVVSIGNFDGLHLGHQAILQRLVSRAQQLRVRSIAMTFSPHPIRFLAPSRAPRLISTLDQKIRLIGSSGIDLLFLAQFDKTLSQLSPEHFVRQYLIDGFKARSICVGGNFNFGYRQTGSVQTLKQFKDNFEIVEIPPVQVRGTAVSSSRIRELVAAGTVSRACRLLGRWFEIEGRIVTGAGRGRTVTVPTLNVQPENELIPKMGVYVTRISLDGGPFMDSVTNIGIRPTFDESELTIETFVLRDTVPQNAVHARLEFVRRLRDEMKFESSAALRSQIAADVRRTERLFRFITKRHA